MSKALWTSFILVLIAGSARAQTFPSGPNNECRFLIADNAKQTNPVLNSDLIEEDRAACALRTPALSVKGKLRYMLRSTYEPKSVMFSLFGAGIKQAMDAVPEWGQGMEGYGRRLASSFGQKIIKRNIQVGIGTFLREDPRYFCSESQGIWRRSLYAASRAFVSNKDGGGIRPGYSKFIATFGGAYISRQWQPERKHKMSEYLTNSAISIGIDAAKNVFSEFWPDLKRMLHR